MDDDALFNSVTSATAYDWSWITAGLRSHWGPDAAVQKSAYRVFSAFKTDQEFQNPYLLATQLPFTEDK